MNVENLKCGKTSTNIRMNRINVPYPASNIYGLENDKH